MTSEDEKLFARAEFRLGVSQLAQLPGDDLPEVAFAGRSNVGKSSLLNALTGRRDLARTSNTPGRTQQLNFFIVDDAFHLVDMPGYGYAKVSKKMRGEWDNLIFDYLRGRSNLRCVFLLIDSRHGLKDSDISLMEMLDEAAVPYRIVLTKADKNKKNQSIMAQIQEELSQHAAAWPEILATSSLEKEGLDILRRAIIERL